MKKNKTAMTGGCDEAIRPCPAPSAVRTMSAIPGYIIPDRGRCWIISQGTKRSETDGLEKTEHWAELMTESGETDRLSFLVVGDPAVCRIPSWEEVAGGVGYTLVEAPEEER